LLRSRGAGPERVVAVALPRGADAVVAVLAVLDSGAAVLPLDLGNPPARLAGLLRAAGAVLLVTDSGSAATLAGHDLPGLVRLDDDAVRGELTERAHAAAGPLPHPDSLAAVTFTSGSTGEPKAVAVPHRALAALHAHHRERLYAAADGPRRLRVAHSASFAFDASWDALLSVLAGHELHVLTEDVYLDADALAGYVASHGIDYLDFTPSWWAGLLATGALPQLPAVAVVGGEGFPPALWTRMREAAAASGSRVLNLYGPTECTVDTLMAEVTDAAEPVVGRGVGDTGAHVLDAFLRPVPTGAVGELYLAGRQLARGYLGAPATTAARFVADPSRPGERMYRTGDLARRRPDGVLEVLGRSDEQISLRGFRVEPGEVERALLQLPGVARAAVVRRDDPGVPARLVGYVVPAAGAAVEPEALRAALAAVLPAHLVPAVLVVLGDLPLTRNGKLDRAALPAPGTGSGVGSVVGSGVGSGSAPDDRRAGPAGEAERALCAVFAEVLGSRAPGGVGPADDFFALGGDSIDTIAVVARARRAGLAVSAREVFERRTPAALALLARTLPTTAAGDTGDDTGADTGAGVPLVVLDERRRAAAAQHLPAGAGARLADVWPLTPTQQGMLVHAETDASDVYTTSLRLDLRGPLDTARVAAALDALLRRHPQLRVLPWQGDLDAPVLLVADALAVPLREVDLTPLGGGSTSRSGTAAAGAALEALERVELAGGVDLAGAPLLRAVLVRLAPDGGVPCCRLLLVAHHVLLDGWSTPLLVAELLGLLADPSGAALPAPADLRPVLRWLAGRDADAAAGVWREALAGAEPLLLGTGTAAVAEPVVVEEVLPAAVAEALAGCARRAGVTLAVLLQVAWAAVLAEVTGRDDVVFGQTVSGRPAEVPGAEAVLGMLITTVPVRVRLEAAAGCAEVLRRTASEQAALLDVQHLGLGLVQRAAGAGALFDSLLVVENYPRGLLDAAPAGAPALTGVGGHDATHYPVTVTALPQGPDGGFALQVEHRPGTVDAALAAELPGRLVRVLTALAARPGAPVAALLRHRAVPVGVPAAPAAAAGPRPAPGAGRRETHRRETHQRETGGTLVGVAAALADVLGAPTADPDDDFFALGGDSISAMQLVGRLRGLGLVCATRDVFALRTPRALAGLPR
ncbi:amino acid adenylation domain-containing protein, partial [Kineococcus glutinatus]|uniref:non-ribosomal peptide synthetase n=1 Tax=Kineococcus glutinatus TaxID=1070872 RepID=UPI0031F10C6D